MKLVNKKNIKRRLGNFWRVMGKLEKGKSSRLGFLNSVIVGQKVIIRFILDYRIWLE